MTLFMKKMNGTCWLMGMLLLGMTGLGWSRDIGSLKQNDCSPCVKVTKFGSKIVTTLIYHSSYSCTGTRGTCTQNHTQYSTCTKSGKVVCFDPQWIEYQSTITIWAYANNEIQGYLVGTNSTIPTHKEGEICFDACNAIDKGRWTTCGSIGWRRSYMLERKYVYDLEQSRASSLGSTQTYWYTLAPGPPESTTSKKSWFNITAGVGQSNCGPDTCTPVCFRFYDPRTGTREFGFGIEGSGRDPGTRIQIQVQRKVMESKQHFVFHSFYEEIGKADHSDV